MKKIGIYYAYVTILLALFSAAGPVAGGDDRTSGLPVSDVAYVSAVEQDSLDAMIRLISLDSSTSLPLSRFAFREADLKVIADTLASRLASYTGNPVERETFQMEFTLDSRDTTFTGENIIARYNTPLESSGVFLVTAHFDAIGSRSAGWWSDWANQPAPGADDNATGVAALMEVARILSGLELPFDLEFALFSGEEIGRLGSIDYVDKCDRACSDRILGVINMDMIGYSAGGTGLVVLTDFYSGWLADLVIERIEETDPSLPVVMIKPGPVNYDHASFWDRRDGRISCISFSEPLSETGAIRYPYYHTTEDLIENVDMEQVQRIAGAAVGFLSGFAGRQPDMEVIESDLLFYRGENMVAYKDFEAGEDITSLVRVRNTGGETPSASNMTLVVEIENRQGSFVVYDESIDIPGVMRSTDVAIPLSLDQKYSGGNILKATISTGIPGEREDNNSAETLFSVEGGSPILLDHHFSPNPVSGAFGDAMFCVNLAEGVNMTVKLMTLEGTLISTATLGNNYGYSLDAGYSCHRCAEIFPQAGNLASGVYIYCVTLFSLDGSSSVHNGRFAVEN